MPSPVPANINLDELFVFLLIRPSECQRKVLWNLSLMGCVCSWKSRCFLDRLAGDKCLAQIGMSDDVSGLAISSNYGWSFAVCLHVGAGHLAGSVIRNFMQCTVDSPRLIFFFASSPLSLFDHHRTQPASDKHQLTISSRSTAFLIRFGFSFLSLCCGVVSVRSWNRFYFCSMRDFLKPSDLDSSRRTSAITKENKRLVEIAFCGLRLIAKVKCPRPRIARKA